MPSAAPMPIRSWRAGWRVITAPTTTCVRVRMQDSPQRHGDADVSVSLWATPSYPKYPTAVCRPAGTGTDQVRTGDKIENCLRHTFKEFCVSRIRIIKDLDIDCLCNNRSKPPRVAEFRLGLPRTPNDERIEMPAPLQP